MSNEWSNDATTSLTLPTGATNPDQRIVLDGTSDTILVYDNTGALIASVAANAGTDGFGNSYPAGISAAGGVISQSIILLYNGTPALNNLVISLTSEPGSDSFGNIYQAGFTVYKAGTNDVLRNIDISGLDTIGLNGSSQFVVNPNTAKIESYDSSGRLALTIDANTGSILCYATPTPTVKVFDYDGTVQSLLIPPSVTQARVQVWGAGGGGRSGSSTGMSGGGGGEYAEEPALTVIPGETLSIYPGQFGFGGSGSNGTNGQDSTVKRGSTTLVIAHGGKGGSTSILPAAGGTGSTNTIHHDGGLSPRSSGGVSQGGSGGGEGAATNAAGNPGKTNSGVTGGAGGSGTNGGNGASGGNGSGSGGTVGNDATSIGGGGGAGGRGSSSGNDGGSGGFGRVTITYTEAAPLEISVSASGGTDEFGNVYPKGIQVGNPLGSRVFINPTGPVINLYDNSSVLNGQWDIPNGRITAGDNVAGILNAFGLYTFGPTFQSGVFMGPGAIPPTTTQLQQAGGVYVDEGYNTTMRSISLGSGTGSDDQVTFTILSGDSTTAYTGTASLFAIKPFELNVNGIYTATTIHDDVVTIPGQVGGGTTTLTITGLGLTAGPTGQWHCLVTADTSVPGTDLKYVSYNAPSSGGVLLKMNRSTNTNTTVSYTLKGI